MMSKLNEKLRILLLNNEWTQKQLAEKLYVSPDAVSSWVRGINNPSLDTIKQLCEIFYIPIQDLTNDELDIPEFFLIGEFPSNSYRYQDSDHKVYDAGLANEEMLHRFTNPGGAKCSAIYRGQLEVWWHYRDHEARMIHEWNERYSHDW